jgi:hypothetical protein
MTWSLVLLLAASCLLGGVSANAGDIRTRARQGIPGAWVYADPNRRSGSGINSQGQLKQISTATLTDPGDNKHIIVTINSHNVSIATGTGGDAASLGALLAAAINADPIARAACVATFATTTLTLTGQWAGVAFDVSIASDPDSALSALATGTAATAASAVAPGVALITTGYNTNGGPTALPNTETERLVCVPTTSIFVAQVTTITVPAVASNVLEAVVWEVRGAEEIELCRVQTTFATDKDTTLDALIAALNLELPSNTVDVAADNATATALVFTAEIKGYEFRARVFWRVGGTAPTITVADTVAASISTSLHRAFVGVSEVPRDTEAATLTSTTGQWPANGGVRYGIRGCMWVSNSETTGPTQGGDVYVELAPGSTAGQLYAASSATRVALSKRVARWERDGIVTADNAAAVRLEA